MVPSRPLEVVCLLPEADNLIDPAPRRYGFHSPIAGSPAAKSAPRNLCFKGVATALQASQLGHIVANLPLRG